MRGQTIETLKELGLKVTPQRQAILKLLSGNTAHPSADGIYREILKEYPGVSFATVYNTLSKLAEAGKIQELDIDPHKKRFDPYTAPHCHFYCTACGRVFDVACDAPLPGYLAEGRTVEGHRVDAVQLNFKGVCKDCTGKGQAVDSDYKRTRRRER